MLEDARDEALTLARVSLVPCGREVEQLGLAPFHVDRACLSRVLKLTFLLRELVTSFAERLPVVLPVVEESPGAIKLGSETLAAVVLVRDAVMSDSGRLLTLLRACTQSLTVSGAASR
jgi:hypothetical protein